jgi:hypothetical protein
MDETEQIRRQMQARINSIEADRALLEHQHGKVWNTTELAEDFEVLGFAAPLVMVRRKADGTKGSLLFQHSPRFYFCFKLG